MAEQGDVWTNGVTTITTGNTIKFQPPSSNEGVIHNLVISGTGEWITDIYDETSTKSATISSDNVEVLYTRMYWHCTNKCYYRVTCISGTLNVHFDGVITK